MSSAIKSYAYCQVCKAWDKPLHKNWTGAVSVSYMCRDCRSAKQRKYYHNNKKLIREIIKRSEAKYPEKQRARLELNKAVKSGKVIKPNCCSECGGKGARIEGHHHDYSKPLDVTWLCSGCHADKK